MVAVISNSTISISHFFPTIRKQVALDGKKGLSSLPIASKAHATEIGLRNRAGYCIFDWVAPVRNRSGFPIGLNY